MQFCGNKVSQFEATLFLVGRLGGTSCGSTIAFALQGTVTGAEPEVAHVTHLWSIHDCYMLEWLMINILRCGSQLSCSFLTT